ncbi:hypothetical protein ACWDCO_28110 [Streptomyces albogriseolus]
MGAPHPLLTYLLEAADGRFPPVDGKVTVLPPLAGRRELSIELRDVRDGGRGHGRSLIADALSLVPEGAPVFAAVSPGNARSLRAFLACGFTPIGSEVLLRPERA